MRPTEAAEVDPGHPGKRHAPVWNAADYNAAMLDAIKPAAETPPPRGVSGAVAVAPGGGARPIN